MAIIVGSARSDENGKYSGGKAGDNNRREVSTQPYYNHSKGWDILRPIDKSVADKLAIAMLDLCNNDNIGYDQGQRTTFISQLNARGSISAINIPCECDCSSGVRGCIIQATGKDVGNFTTANEKSCLLNSGLFRLAEGEVYNGDVLVTKTKGHTVIVVSGNPRISGKTVPYKKPETNVMQGSTGEDVLWVKFVCNLCDQNLTMTPNFNKATTTAVKNVQRFFRLEEDGIVGPKTRKVMEDILKNKGYIS